MKNRQFLISIAILILVALAGFAAGCLFEKESNPAPIIIEKCLE